MHRLRTPIISLSTNKLSRLLNNSRSSYDVALSLSSRVRNVWVIRCDICVLIYAFNDIFRIET